MLTQWLEGKTDWKLFALFERFWSDGKEEARPGRG